jgi:hypothetical protein
MCGQRDGAIGWHDRDLREWEGEIVAGDDGGVKVAGGMFVIVILIVIVIEAYA